MSVLPYRLFRSSLPSDYHTAVWRELAAVSREVGHEDVPAILNGLRDDPAVTAAVTDLLGLGGMPDVCRHVHLNDRHEPGDWHIDDYCGTPWPLDARHAILCYFPQDTLPEMGPTELLIDGQIVSAAGPTGTCALMRHDVMHRAGANTSGRQRYMVKMLFRAGNG